jgi:hypothetical protein
MAVLILYSVLMKIKAALVGVLHNDLANEVRRLPQLHSAE